MNRGFEYSRGRIKLRPCLFWQRERARAGDSFEHRGTEFVVDNVVESPAGGFKVAVHPSAQFRTDEAGERSE
jgi:hypothetical protein